MNRRIEQLNAVLQKSIAEYAAKKSYEGHFIVTITYVHVTPDLSQAEVGFKTFPDKVSFLKKALSILNRNLSELQLSLARSHKLRNIPVIIFTPDNQGHKVDRVEELLSRIDNERR